MSLSPTSPITESTLLGIPLYSCCPISIWFDEPVLKQHPCTVLRCCFQELSFSMNFKNYLEVSQSMLCSQTFAEVLCPGTYNSDFSGLNISEAVFLVNLQMWFELGRFSCSHCYTDPVVSTISCGLMNLGLCCLCSSIPRIQIFLLQSLCEFISRSSMVST